MLAWGMASFERVADFKTPSANDIDAEELSAGNATPDRVAQETFRIVRETYLARQIKKLHNHECQLCGAVVILADGSRYSEGHHVRPLGGTHKGPDTAENILALCPTCHVLLDYFAIPLRADTIRGTGRHEIGAEFVAYHNDQHARIVSSTTPE